MRIDQATGKLIPGAGQGQYKQAQPLRPRRGFYTRDVTAGGGGGTTEPPPTPTDLTVVTMTGTIVWDYIADWTPLGPNTTKLGIGLRAHNTDVADVVATSDGTVNAGVSGFTQTCSGTATFAADDGWTGVNGLSQDDPNHGCCMILNVNAEAHTEYHATLSIVWESQDGITYSTTAETGAATLFHWHSARVPLISGGTDFFTLGVDANGGGVLYPAHW